MLFLCLHWGKKNITPLTSNNSEKAMEEYKIPVSRQARLFKLGRDKWKARSNEKQKQLKYQEIRIWDLEKSRNNWKQKSKESIAELNTIKKELEKSKKKV